MEAEPGGVRSSSSMASAEAKLSRADPIWWDRSLVWKGLSLGMVRR